MFLRRKGSTSKSKGSISSTGSSITCLCCQGTKTRRLSGFFTGNKLEACVVCRKVTCSRCRKKQGTCHVCRVQRDPTWNSEVALQATTDVEMRKMLHKLHFEKHQVKAWDREALVTQLLRRCELHKAEDADDPFASAVTAHGGDNNNGLEAMAIDDSRDFHQEDRKPGGSERWKLQEEEHQEVRPGNGTFGRSEPRPGSATRDIPEEVVTAPTGPSSSEFGHEPGVKESKEGSRGPRTRGRDQKRESREMEPTPVGPEVGQVPEAPPPSASGRMDKSPGEHSMGTSEGQTAADRLRDDGTAPPGGQTRSERDGVPRTVAREKPDDLQQQRTKRLSGERQRSPTSASPTRSQARRPTSRDLDGQQHVTHSERARVLQTSADLGEPAMDNSALPVPKLSAQGSERGGGQTPEVEGQPKVKETEMLERLRDKRASDGQRRKSGNEMSVRELKAFLQQHYIKVIPGEDKRNLLEMVSQIQMKEKAEGIPVQPPGSALELPLPAGAQTTTGQRPDMAVLLDSKGSGGGPDSDKVPVTGPLLEQTEPDQEPESPSGSSRDKAGADTEGPSPELQQPNPRMNNKGLEQEDDRHHLAAASQGDDNFQRDMNHAVREPGAEEPPVVAQTAVADPGTSVDRMIQTQISQDEALASRESLVEFEELEEELEAIVEEPEDVAEESEAIVEEPEDAMEELEAIVEEPEDTMEELEAIVEEPEDAMGELEAIVEEPEDSAEELEDIAKEPDTLKDRPGALPAGSQADRVTAMDTEEQVQSNGGPDGSSKIAQEMAGRDPDIVPQRHGVKSDPEEDTRQVPAKPVSDIQTRALSAPRPEAPKENREPEDTLEANRRDQSQSHRVASGEGDEPAQEDSRSRAMKDAQQRIHALLQRLQDTQQQDQRYRSSDAVREAVTDDGGKQPSALAEAFQSYGIKSERFIRIQNTSTLLDILRTLGERVEVGAPRTSVVERVTFLWKQYKRQEVEE